MTKPRANRLGMYEDVKQVLDAALAAGGGEYELDSYGAAVHWRQRAYQFRKTWAEVHGLTKPSRYDALTLRRVADGSSTVTIALLSEATKGTFRPKNPNYTPTPVDVADDDLLDFADRLKAKIAKGEI